MDEDTSVEETSLLEKENAILGYFKENAPSNPKKLKQFVLRMWNDHPPEIQQGLFQRILRAKDPVGTLNKIQALMDEWYAVVPGLIATGYHGMIVNQLPKAKEIHGFNIKTVEKWLTEKTPWTLDQEIEIMGQALRAWMVASDLLSFTGKVVLFSSFGFSGTARSFVIVNGVPQTKSLSVRNDRNRYLKGLSLA